jgi:hypothetical protein
MTVLFIVALLIVSCREAVSSAPVDPSSAVDRSRLFEETAAAGDSTRYVNQEMGFSLQLPDSWQVIGPQQVRLNDEAMYELYLLGENPSNGSGPGVSRIVIAEGARISVEQFIEHQCSTCPRHPEERVRLGQGSALRTHIGGGGVPHRTAWHFLDRGSRWMGLSIHDPETLEPLQEVLDSFRFE